MTDDQNLIPATLTASMVRSYIDFDGHDTAHYHVGKSVPATSIQAVLQSEGVAALWSLLKENAFAYLADEVGMGKTRQAMGVIATQFLAKPDSRVVIVCSNVTLQRQWKSEWSAFLRTCYKLLDDRLLGNVDANPLEGLEFHSNLRSFEQSLSLGDARIHLLRYSSFRRPISLKSETEEGLAQEYQAALGVDSLDKLTAEELGILREARAFQELDSVEREAERVELVHKLAKTYCHRLGALLTEDDSFGQSRQSQQKRLLDLAVFDEAQYLRHTGNQQNTHIAATFRSNVAKWLFMSATPLHSSQGDIGSLDKYICASRTVGTEHGAGSVGDQVTGIADRLSPVSGHKLEVVDVLRQIMVRRTRTYADRDGQRYDKIKYRKYQRTRHSGADDPFLAITMALVQRSLAGALSGGNNRFRLGECASFESLSASVGRILGRRNVPSSLEVEAEYDRGNDIAATSTPNIAFDRTIIDDLNHRFVARMRSVDTALRGVSTLDSAVLPHAKLNRVVDSLFERSLLSGTTHKTLVFVRRVDTVEEIRDLLNTRFQRDVDQRISDWHTLLTDSRITQRRELWTVGQFWMHLGKEPDQAVDPEDYLDSTTGADSSGEHDDGTDIFGEHPRKSTFRLASELPYFEARMGVTKDRKQAGKFVSFASRLLKTDPSEGPLKGFLLRGQESNPGDSAFDNTNKKNAARWQRFLVTVLGRTRYDELSNQSGYAWLFGDAAGTTPDAWKLASLQLCLLQSMRHSDFIVDLHILHTYVSATPGSTSMGTAEQADELPDKLLWLLEQADMPGSESLATYIANWKERFSRWVEHFDLIADKCFRSGEAVGWDDIYQGKGVNQKSPIHTSFSRMAPVAGRSGLLSDKNFVTQFKFPTYPNILICTDVLKEGVDMHLFCDDIVHYGVAWTSGDLEQRIGRIDRLGSLTERRIKSYGSSEVPLEAPLPRLAVEFPYLDGTLDQHQVERVLRAKIASDLRMDLGKRNDEIGEICIDSLETNEPPSLLTFTSPKTEERGFFPESVRFVQDGERTTQLALPASIRYLQAHESVRAGQATNDMAEESHVRLPRIGALRTRRALAKRLPLLRAWRPRAKNSQLRWTEEVLAPIGAGSDAPLLSDMLLYKNLAGINAVASALFCFDEARNTVVHTANTSLGGARNTDGNTVLLESIDDSFWVLRVAVLANDGNQDAHRRLTGLAERNHDRQWGYFTQDENTVWFTTVVQQCDGLEWTLVELLASQMWRVGRHLRAGERDTKPPTTTYRAASAFPSSITLGRNTHDNSFSKALELLEKGSLSDMKNDDLVVCGRMLAGVQAWFTEMFEAVLESLYASAEVRERGLRTKPLTWVDGGILHMRTEGAERFGLQAYLDLNDASDSSAALLGPKVLWELVASPNARGPKPELKFSELAGFPHTSTYDWRGEPSENCGVYKITDDRYRYLAIYHAPSAWDTSRAALLKAWADVLKKLHDAQDSQYRSYRNAFERAIAASEDLTDD